MKQEMDFYSLSIETQNSSAGTEDVNTRQY